MAKLRDYLDFIKIEHTLFALPFAYLGAILASEGNISLEKVLLIAAAFTGLRTAAMTFNRVIDRDIDAMNPRTKNRHIPSGIISVREAYVIAALALAIYFVSAYLLNELAFLLSPIPAIVAYVYPYLKRFTCLSHYVLGLNLSFAPMGGWIAVTGTFDVFGDAMLPFLIGVAVMFWVAGFDIIYALQDVEFDRRFGLHSIPAHFGVRFAKIVSTLNHAVFLLLLFAAFYFFFDFGVYVKLSLTLISALVVFQHAIIEIDESKIELSFFHANALISFFLLLFTVVEVFS